MCSNYVAADYCYNTVVNWRLVHSQTYTVSAERKEDQKAVDTQLLAAIKKHPDGAVLRKYLKTLFELKHGQFPHQMKF